MLVSEALAAADSVLDDPNFAFWTEPERIAYLNQYCQTAVGLKPDLLTSRVYVNLLAGTEQSIPADGFQILDAFFAGNGQSVFVSQMDDIKHAKFTNAARATPATNVKVVVLDPRSPQTFQVFPPCTGDSAATLQILYALNPPIVDDVGDTYPLPQETLDSLFWYVLAMAFRKTGDRQDLERAATCYANSVAWFDKRSAAQLGETGKPDQ